MKWQEVIKLGKAEVTRQLDDLGIVYTHIKHYFKLCSLLYNIIKNQFKEFIQDRVVSLLDRRNAKEECPYQRTINRNNEAVQKSRNTRAKYADLLD